MGGCGTGVWLTVDCLVFVGVGFCLRVVWILWVLLRVFMIACFWVLFGRVIVWCLWVFEFCGLAWF